MDNNEKITSLTAAVTASFEKKKMEVVSARGAIDGLRELQKSHKTFVENSKAELKAMVTEGKLNQDFANFVVSWLGKSSKVIEEFAVAVKTNHDSKSGEVISLNNVIQLLKQTENAPAQQSPQPSVQSTPVNEPTAPPKGDKRTYKSRLKKNDVMSKTVERLKKSRSQKTKETSGD